MEYKKPLVEFVGTFMALTIIYYSSQKLPLKYLGLMVGLAFFIPVSLFYKISGNFNPAITIMFVLAGKQKPSTLITFIIPQIIAGAFAYLINENIFFRIKI